MRLDPWKSFLERAFSCPPKSFILFASLVFVNFATPLFRNRAAFVLVCGCASPVLSPFLYFAYSSKYNVYTCLVFNASLSVFMLVSSLSLYHVAYSFFPSTNSLSGLPPFVCSQSFSRSFIFFTSNRFQLSWCSSVKLINQYLVRFPNCLLSAVIFPSFHFRCLISVYP